MKFFEKIDFAKGLKTLFGVLILTIPYLDNQLMIGKYVFDVPDSLVAILLTPEAIAFGTGLIVYGAGMKLVRGLKAMYPRK